MKMVQIKTFVRLALSCLFGANAWAAAPVIVKPVGGFNLSESGGNYVYDASFDVSHLLPAQQMVLNAKNLASLIHSPTLALGFTMSFIRQRHLQLCFSLFGCRIGHGLKAFVFGISRLIPLKMAQATLALARLASRKPKLRSKNILAKVFNCLAKRR